MGAKIAEYLKLITTVEFWQMCFASFHMLGPVAAILLAAIESLIPALPLIAIVTLNVAAHGAALGFLYSWIGACAGSAFVFWFFRRVVKRLFIRFVERHKQVKKAREWVGSVNPKVLFLIAVLPFTPSSFLNFAFGISDFDDKTYLSIMVMAKAVMILLLVLFGQSMVKAMENPSFIAISAILVIVLYIISKVIRKRHHLK